MFAAHLFLPKFLPASPEAGYMFHIFYKNPHNDVCAHRGVQVYDYIIRRIKAFVLSSLQASPHRPSTKVERGKAK